MNYTINQWYGRLGNNIQQISNAIFFCKENNINFHSPDHELIKSFQIKFGIDKNVCGRFFFYDGLEKDFNCDVEKLNKARREICLEYVANNFKFFIKEPLDKDILVIHIRSGDIFSRNPHSLYVPNPLSYYRDIIKNYETVLLVSEDLNNPIINELLKDKKVLFQTNSLVNDFSILLRAQNLVSSGVGTFSLAAALCSRNIENFYCSDIAVDEHLNYKMLLTSDIKVHLTKIENYIKIGEWKNTPDQIRQILEHKG
jgi:hypothetical protein